MSLICQDIDKIIVSYIFNLKLYKSGLYNLKTIMIAFGKVRMAQYNDFIVMCRNKFFKMMFEKYKLKNGDIYTLLQKVTFKKNIKYFPCYNRFNDGILDDHIEFNSLKAKHRLIVYYLSLYYGYIWICTKTEMFENLGYNYYNFHYKNDKSVKYRLLKKKRKHNLKYYNIE